jgi:hypothetical protein
VLIGGRSCRYLQICAGLWEFLLIFQSKFDLKFLHRSLLYGLLNVDRLIARHEGEIRKIPLPLPLPPPESGQILFNQVNAASCQTSLHHQRLLIRLPGEHITGVGGGWGRGGWRLKGRKGTWGKKMGTHVTRCPCKICKKQYIS